MATLIATSSSGLIHAILSEFNIYFRADTMLWCNVTMAGNLEKYGVTHNSDISSPENTMTNTAAVWGCLYVCVSPLRAAASTSLSLSERGRPTVQPSRLPNTHTHKQTRIHTHTHIGIEASETEHEEGKRPQIQKQRAARQDGSWEEWDLKMMHFDAKLTL